MARNRQKGIWWWPVFVLGLMFLTLQVQVADREVMQEVQSNLMVEMGIAATLMLDELMFPDWFIGRAMAASSLSETSEKAAEKAYSDGVKAYRQKKYSKSLEHSQRALLLLERLEDENLKARKGAGARFNIGHALRHLDRCEEALQYYAEALQYYAEALARTNESLTYYYQGWCLFILKRHTEAVTSFDQCITIGKSVGLDPNVIKSCQKLQKEALAGAHNQAPGDYDERYPEEQDPNGEYDEPYFDEQAPDGEYDDRYPDEQVPDGGYDDRDPDEQFSADEYDEPYPDEQDSDGGYDDRYPDEQFSADEYDEPYPDEQVPDGEYDEPYLDVQDPDDEHDDGYPDEQVPDGEYDDRYPDEQVSADEYDEPYPDEQVPDPEYDERNPEEQDPDGE